MKYMTTARKKSRDIKSGNDMDYGVLRAIVTPQNCDPAGKGRHPPLPAAAHSARCL
jgi:hypothetical protein